jgi:hypothetical protein
MKLFVWKYIGNKVMCPNCLIGEPSKTPIDYAVGNDMIRTYVLTCQLCNFNLHSDEWPEITMKHWGALSK